MKAQKYTKSDVGCYRFTAWETCRCTGNKKVREVAWGDTELECQKSLIDHANRSGWSFGRLASSDTLPEISRDQFDELDNGIEWEVFSAIKNASRKMTGYYELSAELLNHLDPQEKVWELSDGNNTWYFVGDADGATGWAAGEIADDDGGKYWIEENEENEEDDNTASR